MNMRRNSCRDEGNSIILWEKYLREIDRNEFYDNIHNIRLKINNDRAILRAIHFFDENDRAISEMQAIKNDDFEEFKRLVRESGYSSYMYLQNIFSNNMPKKQAVSLVLALCSEILGIEEHIECMEEVCGYGAGICSI